MEPRATQVLRDAIEKLYDVFAVYPLKAPIIGCSHCTTPDEYARLESKPLRELTTDDLGKYAFNVLYTCGSIDDFKHFLPRLFELIAWHGDVGFTDPQIVFGKLPYSISKGETWSDAEQRAIESFCLAWWRATLDNYEDRGEPSDAAISCLTSIGRIIDDLGDYLRIWREDRSVSALRHLADFAFWRVFSDNHQLNNGNLSAYWERNSSQSQQVIGWLLNPLTADALEDLFFRYTEYPPPNSEWIFFELDFSISQVRGLSTPQGVAR
jgi:hypothetical protein